MKKYSLAFATALLAAPAQSADSLPSPWNVYSSSTGCNLDRDISSEMWVMFAGGKRGAKEHALVFPGALLPEQVNGSTFGVVVETPPTKFTEPQIKTRALVLSDRGKLLTVVPIDSTTLMLAFASNKVVKIYRQSDGVELVAIPMGPDGMKHFVAWGQCNANHSSQK